VDLVEFDLFGGRAEVDAGGVEEDVGRAERRLGVGHHALANPWVGEVGRADERLPARGLDLSGDLSERFLASCDQGDVGAGPRETDCTSPADPAARAGDDGVASREREEALS